MSTDNPNGYVRVMRSHDYNHFEVCLPLPSGTESMKHDLAVMVVDDIRKDAARLVDKAVLQYQQMKAAELVANAMRDDLVTDNETFTALHTRIDERTIRQKVLCAIEGQRNWLREHGGKYDYEDNAPNFDNPETIAF